MVRSWSKLGALGVAPVASPVPTTRPPQRTPDPPQNPPPPCAVQCASFLFFLFIFSFFVFVLVLFFVLCVFYSRVAKLVFKIFACAFLFFAFWTNISLYIFDKTLNFERVWGSWTNCNNKNKAPTAPTVLLPTISPIFTHTHTWRAPVYNEEKLIFGIAK